MSIVAESSFDPSSLIQYFISLLMLTLFYVLSRGERKRRAELQKKIEEEEANQTQEEDEFEDDEDDFYEEEEEESEPTFKPAPLQPIPKILQQRPILQPSIKSKFSSQIFDSMLEKRKLESSIETRKLNTELEALYGPMGLVDIESAYTQVAKRGESKAEKIIEASGNLTSLVLAKEIIGKPRALNPYDS